MRMLGSAAVDLVWVASGKLDASIALSNHPWDMAAGVAIAREAGAIVMDVDGAPRSPVHRDDRYVAGPAWERPGLLREV